MPVKISDLSDERLSNLKLMVATKFRTGVDRGLSFEDLRALRIEMRDIEGEIERRKEVAARVQGHD
jgi:hypothetical protein